MKEVPVDDLVVGNAYRYELISTDGTSFIANKSSTTWKLLKIEEDLLTVRFLDEKWTASFATSGPGWVRKFYLVGYGT